MSYVYNYPITITSTIPSDLSELISFLGKFYLDFSLSNVNETLTFNSNNILESQDLTTLTNTIKTFINPVFKSECIQNYLFSTSNNNWTVVCYWIFPGTLVYTLQSVAFISNSLDTTYDVRIYDQTNNKTIASATFTNSNVTMNTINLPSVDQTENLAMYEFHIKCDDSLNTTIKSISILY